MVRNDENLVDFRYSASFHTYYLLSNNFAADISDVTAVSDEKTQEKQPETAVGDGGANNEKSFLTEVY